MLGFVPQPNLRERFLSSKVEIVGWVERSETQQLE